MAEGGLDRLRPCALVAGRRGWTMRLAGSWRRSRRLGERHERWAAARLARARPIRDRSRSVRGRARRELGGLPVGRILARWHGWRLRREPGWAALRVAAVPALRPFEPARPAGAGTGWSPTPPVRPPSGRVPAGWATVARPFSSSGGRPGTARAAVVVRYQPADLWVHQVTRHRRIEADVQPALGRGDAAASVVTLPAARGGRAAASPPLPAAGERPRGRRRDPSPPGRSTADLAPLPPLAVDRIADEVIRRIERRAVAQYERHGRGRMP